MLKKKKSFLLNWLESACINRDISTTTAPRNRTMKKSKERNLENESGGVGNGGKKGLTGYLREKPD